MLIKRSSNWALHGDQRGQLFIISLILLAIGVLMIVPLLDLMTTHMRTNIIYEDKRDQIYACDAGIEHAIHKIVNALPPIPSLEDDGHNDTDEYTLSSVNGYPVHVTIKKIPLVLGLLGSDEYKIGQPHEDWITFEPPPSGNPNPGEGWVTYNCTIPFNYTGSGNRQIQDIGAFFIPYPGSPGLIVPPYNVVGNGVITLNFLESTETKITSGGFGFIWRWQQNKGPIFDGNSNPPKRLGSLDFTLKVLDADWTIDNFFAFATIKSQDISYVASFNMSKWLITAQAESTIVKADVLGDNGTASIAAWQLNPP